MDERTKAVIERLENAIKELDDIRSELLNCNLSPVGAWIHQYPVTRYCRTGSSNTYIYAKWQANKPVFKRNPKKHGSGGLGGYTKNKHIGRVNSTTHLGMDEAVKEAYESWENRKRLELIEKVLEILQVMPLGK